MNQRDIRDEGIIHFFSTCRDKQTFSVKRGLEFSVSSMANTDITPRTSISKTPRSSIKRTSFKRRSSGRSQRGSTSTWSEGDNSIFYQQWSPILGGSGYSLSRSCRTSFSRSRSTMSRSSIARSPTTPNVSNLSNVTSEVDDDSCGDDDVLVEVDDPGIERL